MDARGYFLPEDERDSIEIKRLLAEAQRRSEELALLNRINRALTSTLDYSRVLLLILQEVNNILEVEAASVSLLDETNTELVFEYAVGTGAKSVRGMRLPADQGVVGWVVSHGEPALVPDPSQDERFYQDVDRRSGFSTQAIVCAPLKTGDRIIGAIEAMNKLEGDFDQDDLRFLIGVADQAAVAIENARMYRELARQSAELEARNQELLETQDRLVRTERLAALGQVGLALRHEINNPLAAILAGVDLVLESNPNLDAQLREDLEMIGDMAERISRIVSRLDKLEDRTTVYWGDMEMIDLSASWEETEEGEPDSNAA
jgi:GAF domain-containing protein